MGTSAWLEIYEKIKTINTKITQLIHNLLLHVQN